MKRINSKKTIIDNIRFDSITESKYYLKLKEDKKNNKIKDFEIHPYFILQHKYIIVNNTVIDDTNKNFNRIKKEYKALTNRAITYTADYSVINNDNSKQIIDIKGSILTTEFKIKQKMFEYKYGCELILLSFDEKTREWIDTKEYIKLCNQRKKMRKNKKKKR